MAEQRVTLLYDEGCALCVALARWVAGRAQGPRIVTAAIGSTVGARLLRDLPVNERYAAMHVVDPRGRRRSGGAAAAPLLRELGLRRLAAVAEAFPAPFATSYELLARHRRGISRLVRTTCRFRGDDCDPSFVGGQ